MQLLRLTIMTVLLAAAVGIQGASALSIDDSNGGGHSAAALAGDPDDKIPYPHVADDGAQPANNFQAQPVANGAMTFSIAPGGSNGPSDNAFKRAQDRMGE